MDEGHKEMEMVIWEKMEVKQQHVTGGKHANIKEFVLMFKEKGFVFNYVNHVVLFLWPKTFLPDPSG